jgi:hypothetical protein
MTDIDLKAVELWREASKRSLHAAHLMRDGICEGDNPRPTIRKINKELRAALCAIESLDSIVTTGHLPKRGDG